jgi:hypothetical protein
MMPRYEAAALREFDPVYVPSGVGPPRSGRGREGPESARPRRPSTSQRRSGIRPKRLFGAGQGQALKLLQPKVVVATAS